MTADEIKLTADAAEVYPPGNGDYWFAKVDGKKFY